MASIVNATIRIQDDTLYNATMKYLQSVDTKFSLQLLEDMTVQYHSNLRSKRSLSYDWANPSSIYDYVQSLSTRRADKTNYKYHKAILWGKKLGPSKVHVNIAAGGFAGVGKAGYKAYGKVYVDAYCYGKTYTALEGDYMSSYDIDTLHSKVKKYFKLLGTTRINYSSSKAKLPYEKSWSRNFGSIRLFRFQYNIFVYVGVLKFYLQGDVTVDAGLSISMKTIKDTKSDVQVGPTFVITGGVAVTLALVRYIISI